MISRHSPCAEISVQNAVGRARIDVVSAEKNPSPGGAAFLAHEVLDGWNCLLIGCGSRIEDISRAFLTFISYWIEEQAVQFLEDRQNGLAGGRGPAAEHHRNLFLREQIASLFGEEVRVGAR